MNKTETKEKRPPVVVVMGHIDHGKSTLLDYIRSTKVVEKEAGGITQHMSAYEVEVDNPEKKNKERITFLDTPGHESFQAIRARGAKVADIAILVVAADDGVKPQTLEALKCIKEEKIPFIVAINKIDKPDANVERTKNNLAENEIYLEGLGGDVPFVEISAKKGQNIPGLLELIILVAELENLEGNPNDLAEGVILESNLDPKKGIVATLIITNGTLKKGMFVVSEKSLAPLRIMEDFLGEKIEEASFSSPIRIIGWNQMPKVGAAFQTFEKKKEAEKSIASYKEPEEIQVVNQSNTGGEEKVTIPIVLKADTAGSLEALEHELKKLDNERIVFKIVSSGIGTITENDVKSSISTEDKAVILGFNVKTDNSAEILANREGITIQQFDIIYKMTEWLKTDLAKLLPKIMVEEITGTAKILKVFSQQKNSQIIGGRVEEGAMTKSDFRIRRRENIVGEGKVKELQSKKEKVGEVKEGAEFGANIESKISISAGDVLEFFKISEQSVKI